MSLTGRTFATTVADQTIPVTCVEIFPPSTAILGNMLGLAGVGDLLVVEPPGVLLTSFVMGATTSPQWSILPRVTATSDMEAQAPALGARWDGEAASVYASFTHGLILTATGGGMMVDDTVIRIRRGVDVVGTVTLSTAGLVTRRDVGTVGFTFNVSPADEIGVVIDLPAVSGGGDIQIKFAPDDLYAPTTLELTATPV
jgi:hypothetical protein